jgi:hypothetical protein
MNTLFELPQRKFKGRKPRVKWTQQERCRRCAGSASDSDGAYCHRFDLCIEFDRGRALLTKNGLALTCDGKKWIY